MKVSFEDAILRAIDEGDDLREVVDWQLKCVVPMQEPFTTEEMTAPSLQKTLGLKKQELRLLHLVDAVHGEGLYSKQIAQPLDMFKRLFIWEKDEGDDIPKLITGSDLLQNLKDNFVRRLKEEKETEQGAYEKL